MIPNRNSQSILGIITTVKQAILSTTLKTRLFTSAVPAPRPPPDPRRENCPANAVSLCDKPNASDGGLADHGSTCC